MKRLVKTLALCSVGALRLLAQPVNVSVSPSSGSGASQTFSFTASSSAGYHNLAWMEAIFNYSVAAEGACYLFVSSNGAVSISSDTGYTYGSGWAASGVLGTSGTIANSQCSLNLGASSLSGSGNNLTATLSLTFEAGLPGPQQIFMVAADNSGLTSNWQQMGTWTTSAVSSQPPTLISVTPAAGGGMTQTFRYTASSANGSGYLMQVLALFNNGLYGTNACYVYYNRPANGIVLLNDSDSEWLWAPLRRPGTISNGQCTVDAGASAAVASGNTLTLDLVITFNAAWTGPKNNYAYLVDRAANLVGWTQMGTWTVGAPTITTDPRRTGIYSTGSYWGGGGEQIDTLSGNLNFSLPLLTAQGRTGWTVPVGLTYNSQNWRQDNGANLELGGGDVGYGFGWQMQIGSVTPYTTVTQNATATDHYVYADGSGAQYRLDVNNNGVWSSSSQSVYVWFDSNANKLHFRDGTFWVMGCTSSSGEADADTMYPTTVEDVNGNQVLIVYKGGAGIPSASTNTSARISTITDVRAPSGGVTYNFTYNSDSPVPHLAGITNTIGTAETFNFTYAGAALGPPFGTDSSWAGQTTSHLATMNVPSTGNYQFTYDSAGAGELGQVTFPYGGHLRWVYQNFQYAGGRTLREVSARYVAADSAGAVEWGSYTITHPDAANSVAVHSSTTLTDASGNGAKTWNFLGGSSPAWAVGLISDFAQKATPGSTYGITHDYYTWSQNAGGHPYISAKTSLMDEGTGNQQSALTTQTQDGYGNTTQSVVYPFNNTSTPLKTYNSTYLNAAGYSANYIFNRLLTTTLTTGGTVKTLMTNYYDGKLAAGQSNPNVSGCSWVFGSGWQPTGSTPSMEFDSTQPVAWASRGQVSLSTDPAKYTCFTYYNYGFASAWASDGTSVTASSNASTNYAAPSTITTQSYGETIAYNSWLGVTQTTGLNGETLYLSYDYFGRPTSAVSPYGATTTYGYPTGLPVQQTKGGPDGVTRTTLDGLGRTIRVERGPSGYTSVVDTVYAPCACSPLGKIQKVSAPYPSGQSAANWTIYSYDGIGRTVSTVQPDGASTTTYSYSGNQTTVTDAAGKWKTFTNDSLGNLVSVTEPDPANQPGGTLTTSYTYDWMNHLSGVTMPRSSATQTRSFVYDDAGRLTSATNPENGTVSYYYNSANTLQYKHDAKGQDTVYTYDTQNRVTEIQRYANGKNNAEDMCQRVTYSYDTNPYDSTGKYQYTTGRLTAAVYPVCNVLDSTNVSVTEMYSYHPAGGVTIKDLHIYKPWWNSAYGNWSDGWGDVEADYSYNTAGLTSSLVLPSALVPSGCCASVIQPVTYTYGYDGMARPASMVDNNPNSNNGSSTTWAQNVSYDFSGRLTNWQRHTGGNNFDTSVAETLGYNVNSQLTSMSWSYQDQNSGSWGAASGIQYVYSASQNNGQITQAVESWSGQNISYQYDALKRLISAASTPTGGGTPAAWTETMQYDGFGNLTAKVLNGATTSIPVNAATNRLSNASYDANGNMISGAGATLGYDEANRIVSAAEYSGGTEYYAYAPDGKRMFRMEADGVTQEWTFWGARGEKLGTFAMVYSPYVGNSSHPYQMVVNPTLSFAGKTIWDGGKPLVQDRVGTNRATGARYYPFGMRLLRQRTMRRSSGLITGTGLRVWIMRISDIMPRRMGGLTARTHIRPAADLKTREVGIDTRMQRATLSILTILVDWLDALWFPQIPRIPTPTTQTAL